MQQHIGSQCPSCGILENSKDDIELNTRRIACACGLCKTWYHDVCAEKCGVFDNDDFNCINCTTSSSCLVTVLSCYDVSGTLLYGL